jgi:hypothetical protein
MFNMNRFRIAQGGPKPPPSMSGCRAILISTRCWASSSSSSKDDPKPRITRYIDDSVTGRPAARSGRGVDEGMLKWSSEADTAPFKRAIFILRASNRDAFYIGSG